MFKKTIAVALTAIVSCLSSIAHGQPDKAASVKAEVRKIGIGERSAVRVKLKDGTELRGYLSQIENDSFTITDKGTKKASSVSYGDVQSLKLKGKRLSIGTKILIGVGIGVAITAGIIAYAATHLKF
jgi:hypothetical protein